MEEKTPSSAHRAREKSSQADRKQRFEATHQNAMDTIKAEADQRREKTERLRKLREKREN